MKIIFFRLMKWRIIRYLISGGSAFVTNIALLFILVHFFQVWYLLAAVISFIVAVYVSFTMQKYFTFNDYTKEKIKEQTAFYFGVQVFNLGLNTLFMYIGVDLLNIHYIISQILVGGIIALYSFFIYKNLVFPPMSYNKNMPISICPSCYKTENKEWGNRNGYMLVRCDSCGLIFVSPMPEETANIYSKDYFTGGKEHGYVNYDRDKEPMRHTLELYLEHMERALGKKGKLLDVGSATGFFMDVAKKRGWEVEGVEISEHAASIGRLKGLNIHIGVLENINLPKRYFDVVTFFDVVEHLRDPKSNLLEVKKLLKEDGIMVVTTPDAGSLWAKIFGQHWHMVVPPEHLILFNRKNFADLLLSVGLNPILVTNIGKRFTIPYIFQILFNWQGFSIWSVLARTTNRGFLSKLKIPINLHDNFFMIAKKQ